MIFMAWVYESHPEADAVARGWFGIQELFGLTKTRSSSYNGLSKKWKCYTKTKLLSKIKKLEGGSLHEVVGITASQADVKISFKLTNLSSKTNGLDKTTYGGFVDIDPKQDEILLRTLIDHSVIESFGGGGKTCITARVYPTLAIGKDARLFAFNNGTESVVISELSA
ncbi:fructan 6-exohydrolase [Tanacetum coccineum]